MVEDTELAKGIKEAVELLNTRIKGARTAGLRVEVHATDDYIRFIHEDPDEPHHYVNVKVLRRI